MVLRSRASGFSMSRTVEGGRLNEGLLRPMVVMRVDHEGCRFMSIYANNDTEALGRASLC